MDAFELKTTLDEFGINVPDKCRACPHLGKLATTLSKAQENRSFLIASSDEDVLAANARAQLADQVRERYPDATDEQVANTTNNSVAKFLASEQYTDALKNAGRILEEEDATIASNVESIGSLISECPPEGCGFDI